MKLNYKNLKGFGFKYHGMFEPVDSSIGLFSIALEDEKEAKIVFVCSYGDSQHIPCTLGVFNLTKEQFKKYKSNKLSLLPPGHCSPSTSEGETLLKHCRVLYSEKIKSKKHLQKLLSLI